MKFIKSRRGATAKQRRSNELQAREYIARYHPEMLASKIEISACSHFAQVKAADPALQNPEQNPERLD